MFGRAYRPGARIKRSPEPPKPPQRPMPKTNADVPMPKVKPPKGGTGVVHTGQETGPVKLHYDFVRYIIESRIGYYTGDVKKPAALIADAMRIHKLDDACVIANVMNKKSEEKWVVLKINIRYEVE